LIKPGAFFKIKNVAQIPRDQKISTGPIFIIEATIPSCVLEISVRTLASNVSQLVGMRSEQKENKKAYSQTRR